ncbi:Dabb family protein [Cesiribacter andamanensis]|uniref:Stress responsive A/B Barrel Domain protein n=1 Tax=Cesiribacter andamanensis AMV16 TaxID=1279009 RepID=M7P1Y6_9BACT|nr:Dabb family protein [Cesiribacter andamanensis]EMR04599.1 Stress responsive A/B Barrel Domain protein [Cesiribacter andamanensis AMV16]
MTEQTRRSFLGRLAKGAALGGLLLLPGQPASAGSAKKGFIHQVYFWLRKPENEQDKARLLEGLRMLSKVKTIREYHIGVPAGATRDVVDASYAISWMLVFKDKAAQDAYQVDPIHLKFVEEYSALWSKVVVYDSIAVE